MEAGGPPPTGSTSSGPASGTPGRGTWVSPTGKGVRGCDAYGCGGFGARRTSGGRTYSHQGTDFVSTPGQEVVAPTEAIVNRSLQVYPGDSRFSGVEVMTSSGETVKLFYMAPDRSLIGSTVAQGQSLGVAQDLSLKFPVLPTGSMTNHVHVEIRFGGQIVDPASFFQ